MNETVKAKDVRMGDEIEVDLGMGKTFRPVDKIAQDDAKGTVTITLFSSFERRPKFTVNLETLVMRRGN